MMTVEEAKDVLTYMIDDIRDFCSGGKHMSDESKREMEALDMAVKTLEKQSLRWIPTSEKLPRVGEDVLVSVDKFNSKRTDVAYMLYDSETDEYWFGNHLITYGINDVLAWMYPPEPYEEDD